MISKELLSEVLELNIVCVSNFLRKDNMLEYQFLSSRNKEYGLNNAVDEIIYPPRQINIYELAHECKQWAVSKGYSLYSGYDKLINKYGVYVNLLLLGDDELTIGGWDTEIYFIANTETEAIFKACEYIMENKCGS